MKTALIGSIVMGLTAALSFGTPRSIGGLATLDVPDNWSFVNSGDPYSFIAESPDSGVSIFITSITPDNQPDITAKTSDGLRVLLDAALSKIELQYIYETVADGYFPITIGQPTSSFGKSDNGDSYLAWRSNTYSLYYESGLNNGSFNVQVTTQAQFDGNRIYLLRYWASEFATNDEQTVGLDIINNKFRSTKVGNPDADPDGDLINNLNEVLLQRSNPLSKDTNADGISDTNAVLMGLNPKDDTSKIKQYFKQNPQQLGLLAPQIYVKTAATKLLVKKQATYAIDDNFRATLFWAKNLPPGLSVNERTGIISGIPTKVGSFRATVYAKGSVYGTAVTKQATVRFQVE